jgi:hypothetical protein
MSISAWHALCYLLSLVGRYPGDPENGIWTRIKSDKCRITADISFMEKPLDPDAVAKSLRAVRLTVNGQRFSGRQDSTATMPARSEDHALPISDRKVL